MAELAALVVGDPPELWAELGFVVDAGEAHVSGVRHVLGGADKGVRGWAVCGMTGGAALDGLVPMDGDFEPASPPTSAHANGVVALDHLVITTPDLGRTIEHFEEAGLELRRTRNAGAAHQAFFKAGAVILEVVGPPRPTGDGPARFMGLAWTVGDLDETARYLGPHLRPAKDAVQPGRRIATLDRAAGSTVPMAFMSADR